MIVRPGLRPLMLATLLVGIASLNGCKAAARTLGNPLIVHNHQAAQSLIGIAGAQLDASDRMLATTFTTNDHAPVTSSFGRMASQQLVSAFSAEGYKFVQMDPAYTIAAHPHQHEAVLLVGTYAIAERNIYVTARLVRTHDGIILASHDYAVPYTADMRRLLRPERW